MRIRILPIVAGVLASAIGSAAHGAEYYAITLNDLADGGKSATAHCVNAMPCMTSLEMLFGKIKADIVFRMEMGRDGFEFRSVDWEAAQWHFDFAPIGRAAFPLGHSQGTLWLVRVGGLQQPVLRDPQAIQVGSIEVSIVREKGAASPSQGEKENGHVPM